MGYRHGFAPEHVWGSPITAARWTISTTFLGLVAAMLGIVILMRHYPDQARYLVFFFVLAGWLISLCLHEFGRAIVAYMKGDHSVRDNGYLTLDPLAYTHPLYSIVWPMIFLAMGGIGLPGGAVYIDRRALRSRLDHALVSAGGPLATLAVLILLVALLRSFGNTLPMPLYLGLSFLAFLELTSLVLTLLPIPGFDGWGIIEPWLPEELQIAGAQAAGVAPTLLFALFLLVPEVNFMFWRAVYDLAPMLGLDTRAAIGGLQLFRFWR